MVSVPVPNTKWEEVEGYFMKYDIDENYQNYKLKHTTLLKYMRLSFRTGMDKVIPLLTNKDKWNLKQPKLIISVTGGAKCVLNPRLKETFCKSLVKVATTTQSWVISGGKNQVSSYVHLN